jgi:hypothetical protein
MLLRVMPEPSTTEGRRIQGEHKNLLEGATVRWTESSASQRQGYPSEHRAATSRFMREGSAHTGRTRNTAPAARVASATSTITTTVGPTSTRGCAEATTPGVGDATTAGRIGVPRPNHSVCRLSAAPYDGAPFPTWFRPPTTITKYSGETRPELWLADYRLACQLGGTDDDNLIIRNLPLFLSDTARAWLEHLPPGQISNWDDLVQAFAGNFQGTYVRPENSWDL